MHAQLLASRLTGNWPTTPERLFYFKGPEDVILSSDRSVRPVMARDLSSDKPPFFETWPRLYGFVAGWLVFLIVLFYAFTRAYQFLP